MTSSHPAADRGETVSSDAVSSVLSAHERVGPSPYDEAFDEVSHRINQRGHLTKADIGALVCWKRLNASTRWAANLMATPERDVIEITSLMVDAVRSTDSTPVAARSARGALSELPGFRTGDALSSALISATDPHRMAVYDRRAHRALTLLGFTLTNDRGRYSRYMTIVCSLQAECARLGRTVGAHDLDVALFHIGG